MSDPMRLSRVYVVRLVSALSLIVLLSLAFILPVPYVTLKPGPAYDTLGDFQGDPMFTFGKGVKTYPTDGDLDFTTVSVTRPDFRLSFFSVASSWIDGDNAVLPRSLVYREGTTAESSQKESAAQFDSSKDTSRVAALRAAGYAVPEQPRVAGVLKDGAAATLLEAGDIVREVNGRTVASAEATIKAVGALEPGDDVTLGITRKGKDRSVDVTLGADEADPTVPRLGITLGTKYDFPIKIDNNVGRQVGGPSAGSMFALAIYDKLTPGSLTGGQKVAGTGEISADGVVGSIGGISQKIAGASKAGARVFLVPAPNCQEALDGDTKGLKLVKIEKLDDAISSLEALAKNPQAEVPSCS